MNTLSDQDLLLRLAHGSHEAFSIIYKKYWQKVFLFAYDRLKDTKQSQDIVQDIFVSLWDRKEKLEIDNLNAWLYASVRYSILKLIDAESVKNHLFASLKHLTPESASPDSRLVSAELFKAYRALIEKMPTQRRRILQMRHEENMKTRQIANSLNISQKTVQNQLLSAYQEIRLLLARVLLFTLSTLIIYLALG